MRHRDDEAAPALRRPRRSVGPALALTWGLLSGATASSAEPAPGDVSAAPAAEPQTETKAKKTSRVTVKAAPKPGLTAAEIESVLGEVSGEIRRMDSDVKTVADAYAQPIFTPVSLLERRLREGELQFLVEDYIRAAIVLSDVVAKPENARHPLYPQCVFVLAEALRLSGHHQSALAHYRSLLPQASGVRLKEVVFGILFIAEATDNYKGVDAAIRRLREAGPLARPEVDYIYAKMVFRRGATRPKLRESALKRFSIIPETAEVAAKASYFAGVAAVSLGQLQAAVPHFKAALARADLSPERDAIRTQAHLALGRLLQELGDTAAATDHYNKVSRESPEFQHALYELAWAHVHSAQRLPDPDEKLKAYGRAQRSLELLMAMSPDPRLFPEARILLGNLLIRLGAPETAYATFQELIDQYGGAREQLRAMNLSGRPPKELYERLMGRDPAAGPAMPTVAQEWARSDPSVERAVHVGERLKQSEADILENRRLVETLAEALQGEQRYRMFPGLAAARAKALSVSNRLSNTELKLLALERQVLLPYLSEDESAALMAKNLEAAALERRVRTLPRTEEQLENQREQLRAQHQTLGRDIFQRQVRLDSMRAQIVAVESWLVEHRGGLNAGERALVDRRLAEAKTQIEALETNLRDLTASVRKEEMLAGNGVMDVGGETLRAAYTKKVQEQEAMLAGFRSRLPSAYQSQLLRADQSRAELRRLDGRLGALQARLDEQVDVKVADFQKALAKEVRALGEHQTRHAGLEASTEALLGPVAQDALRGTEEKFKKLVLRADVGIIDVAWARKQAATDTVSALVQEQQMRLGELEQEFVDILEEE